MSEQTFKSPGFFEREIDLSGTSASSFGTPAGVIGTSLKGPAFLPVTVTSFDEFIEIFGKPDGKQFGPYAVKEFLKNRDALTFVRVLGAGGDPTADTNNAGFKVEGNNIDASLDDTDVTTRPVGHTQFLIAEQNESALESVGNPLFTDSDINTAAAFNMVRGMILMPSGTRMMMHPNSALGAWDADTTSYDDSATPDSDGLFKLILSGVLDDSGDPLYSTDGFDVKVFSASLDPDNDLYIKNILNTDPTKFVEKGHLLYADFPVEDDMLLSITDVKLASDWDSATETGLKGFGDFTSPYTSPKTTKFISQPFGDVEYDLFHFETLNDGASMNEQFKVTISSLKFSVVPEDPWGTFTVQIRNFFDTDNSKEVIEQFANCNLNPASPNYVAKRIGDKKIYYNFQAGSESERRMVKSGQFENKSSYVRIVMSSAVKSGDIPEDTLPFGFRGLPLLDVTGNNLRYSSGTGVITDLATVHMPPVPYRFKITKGSLASTATYTGTAGTNESVHSALTWGIKSTRLSSTLSSPLLQPNKGDFNPLLRSYVKLLGKSDSLTGATASDSTGNNKFTLSRVALNNDDITALSSPDDEMLMAAYIRNGDYMTADNLITDDVGGGDRVTFASMANYSNKSLFNTFSKYTKFTNIFYGGFDGVNILDSDMALLNDKSTSIDTDAGGLAVDTEDVRLRLGLKDHPAGEGTKNNAVNSFRSAINILTDEMSSTINILAIPGMREAFITDYAADKVRDYGMAIYLMDMISYGYAADGATEIRIFDNDAYDPDTTLTIGKFSSRSIDNNYVATYYPDIKIYDEYNDIIIEAPASIAAMAAISYTDAVSYPWFAPAGFNRASLDVVEGVTARLNTADRDALYESRINPIATFPNAGYVIFGQKTLQLMASSLDRVNVRRMLLEVKRQVTAVAKNMLFEQNNAATRSKFVSQLKPKLSKIQTQQGIDQFSITVDDSNNTPSDIESNKMNGRIVLVPTRAIEYVAIDFIVTSSGVSFE